MSHCVAVIAVIALLVIEVHSWCPYLEEYFMDEMQCLKFMNLKATVTDAVKKATELGASERCMDRYCRTGSQ